MGKIGCGVVTNGGNDQRHYQSEQKARPKRREFKGTLKDISWDFSECDFMRVRSDTDDTGRLR